MMGHSYYYEDSFIENLPNELHIHDCMWSGECFHCQPGRVAFPLGAPITASAGGTVPITVGGNGYITLSSTHQESIKKAASVGWTHEKSLIKTENERSSDESSSSAASSSSSESSPGASPRDGSPEPLQQKEVVPQKVKQLGKSHGRKSNSAKSSFSSSDNKKLRHREVEKNRHRQLQAMVKTLSDKIPGKLDKETQVQTMKRAARYCVFLRDVMQLLSHGQTQIPKEKLDNMYARSCDSVELLMSQPTSAR